MQLQGTNRQCLVTNTFHSCSTATTYEQVVQGTAIRDSLLLCPFAERNVVACVCYDRFDVLVELRPDTNVQLFAQALRNWEDLTLRSMLNAQVIRPSFATVAVNPPEIWLKHPTNVCHVALIQQLGMKVGIEHAAAGSELGVQLLKLQSSDACRRLHECTIPCGVYGSAVLTSGNASIDHASMTACGMESTTDLTTRLQGIAPPSPSRLTAAAVTGLGN